MSEREFLERTGAALEPLLGHRPEMHLFKEVYFEALDPNQPMIELMRAIKARGYRMALLTNNVREWEPLWRSMLPVDEIFELVVDSAFVGMRKPDPPIYELTIERLGTRSPRGMPVRRRRARQHRGGARAWDERGPLSRQRPGRRRDRGRARRLSDPHAGDRPALP